MPCLAHKMLIQIEISKSVQDTCSVKIGGGFVPNPLRLRKIARRSGCGHAQCEGTPPVVS